MPLSYRIRYFFPAKPAGYSDPYPKVGLVEYHDVNYISSLQVENGRVVRWLDQSTADRHVTVPAGESGPLAAVDSGITVPQFDGSGNLAVAFNGGMGFPLTVVMLFKALDAAFQTPWATPGGGFIYIDAGQLKTHFGLAYGNLNNILPGWNLGIFSIKEEENRWYQTGMAAPASLTERGDFGLTGIHGSAFGQGRTEVRQFMLYNRAFTDAQMLALRDLMAAEHSLSL